MWKFMSFNDALMKSGFMEREMREGQAKQMRELWMRVIEEIADCLKRGLLPQTGEAPQESQEGQECTQELE